ncbi:hypothetical protein IKE99_01445 [Candidatus Saccharibacteria bacterium]|nr:hypothetical protein [Candidatus Saccharibacteria bacterium]
MEDYLIDRETLEKFIDELIKKRPLPVNNPEEIGSFKEKQIKALDNSIIQALFGNLTESQSVELNNLLAVEQENPSVFQSFFQKYNINVEKTISDAMTKFGVEYLRGGQNV